jgi:hypothetical protein
MKGQLEKSIKILFLIKLFSFVYLSMYAKSYEQVCLEYILNKKEDFKNPLYDYYPDSKVEFYYYPVVQDLKFWWEKYNNIDKTRIDSNRYNYLKFYSNHESLFKDSVYTYNQYKYFNRLKLSKVKNGKIYKHDNTVSFFNEKKEGINCLIFVYSKIKINLFYYVSVSIEFFGSYFDIMFKLDPINKIILDFHTYFAVT